MCSPESPLLFSLILGYRIPETVSPSVGMRRFPEKLHRNIPFFIVYYKDDIFKYAKSLEAE